MRKAFMLLVLASLPLFGQGSQWDGNFLVEILQIETSGGRNLQEVRSASGPMMVSRSGDFEFNGSGGVVMEKGFGRFLLSNPFGHDDAALRVLASEGGEILVGSSAGVHGIDSLFLAVRQPSEPIVLSPETVFHGGMFRMAPGVVPLADSRYVTLDSVTNEISLDADGRGTANLPGVGSLRVSISSKGNYLIGAPADGPTGIFFAVRKSATPPAGLFFSAMLSISQDALHSGTGSATLSANGELRVSQQEHSPAGTYDLRGAGTASSWEDARASFQGFFLASGTDNSIVIAGNADREALLAVLIPAPQPEDVGGVFLHPHGVVDAASMAPAGNPLAPDGLVSLFGLRLAEQTVAAQTIPLPHSLGGVSVNVNGTPAGLLLVSPGQINMHLPAHLDTHNAVFEVSQPLGASDAVRVRIAPSSPAIFSTNQGGTGGAVVTHADYQLVSASHPARAGEVVILFLTGMGIQQPPPIVFVNDDVAELQYAGPHSVFVGLYQINFKLPAFLSADPNAALTLRTREGWSGTVTLAVTP